MNLEELKKVCTNFEIEGIPVRYTQLTDGHINDTYYVDFMFRDGHFGKYILQKLNTKIFKNYMQLTDNVESVCEFLKGKVIAEGGDPTRNTLTFIRSKNGKYLYDGGDEGCWRMSLFITGATAHQSADLPGLLYSSAKGFGHFQYQLSSYPAETLFETIPNFHNTVSRLEDFKKAVADNAAGRLDLCRDTVDKTLSLSKYASMITDAIAKGDIPLRVTHNDTKLNNIMIDDITGEAACVIDLDTVMPGSMLYDFGDSIRFAASNGAEDEPNLDLVYLRLDLYDDYVHGYIDGVGENITVNEIKMLSVSALILTYELVLRFLGDYLNGDTYFKISYPEHNLVRAKAQLKLCLDMEAKLDKMNEIVRKYTNV